MGHVHRFYVPPETVAGDSAALEDGEAHHALHVVRVKPGDAVGLFDGAGRAWAGRVAETGRRTVRVAIESAETVPQPPQRVTIAQANLNHRGAMDELIRRGTELGVAAFCVFRGGHSERAPRLDPRWTRAAIESCKQCGRHWLPTFQVTEDLDAALAAARGTVLVASQDAPARPLREVLSGPECTVVVGPEGDFSGRELERVASVARVSLGPYTYRAEVAATLLASLVLYELGAYGPS